MKHYHTELKENYEHLQKRTWQLFELGQKREGRLEGALTNVWHELGRISELDSIADIKERLLKARCFIGDVLTDNKPFDEASQQAAEPEGESGRCECAPDQGGQCSSCMEAKHGI